MSAEVARLRKDLETWKTYAQQLRERCDQLEAALENIADDEMGVTSGSQRRAWQALKDRLGEPL